MTITSSPALARRRCCPASPRCCSPSARCSPPGDARVGSKSRHCERSEATAVSAPHEKARIPTDSLKMAEEALGSLLLISVNDEVVRGFCRWRDLMIHPNGFAADNTRTYDNP